MAFQDQLSLNAGQKYWEHSVILSTALSYHMALRPLFCLFLSGSLRQVFSINPCFFMIFNGFGALFEGNWLHVLTSI